MCCLKCAIGLMFVLSRIISIEVLVSVYKYLYKFILSVPAVAISTWPSMKSTSTSTFVLALLKNKISYSLFQRIKSFDFRVSCRRREGIMIFFHIYEGS